MDRPSAAGTIAAHGLSGDLGAILLVGMPDEASTLIRRGLAVAGDAHDVVELGSDDPLDRRGGGADWVDAVVAWHPGAAGGVAFAQRVARTNRELAVLVVAPPEHLDAVNRALRFAPFLGEEVIAWSSAELELIGAELVEAAERTRLRRAHRMIVAQATERLAAAPERRTGGHLEHLLRHAPIGVATLDTSGVVVACNPELARLLGVDRDAVPGRPFEASVPGDDRARVRRLVSAAGQERGTPVTLALVEGGRPEFVELWASRRMGVDEEPVTVVVVADVTERERAAARLNHLQAVTDAALGHLELDGLLSELLSRICSALQVDTAAVLLPDDHDEGALRVRASLGLDPDLRRVRIPVGQGFAGRIARERQPLRLSQVEESDVVSPAFGASVASLLGVPLLVGRELIGVLHVGSLHPREFDDDDQALLQLVGDRAALAINQARLYEQEHEAAAVLQRSLLPKRLPDLPGLGLAATYQPGGPTAEVGGDWYDVMELGGGEVGLSIGDVVGRGLKAASVMGQLRAALRAYAVEGHRPAAALRRLNDLILQGDGGLATAAHAIWDPREGNLHLAVAGHPPPLLITPEGEARLIEGDGGPALGVVAFASYSESTVRLEPGARLVLYTDGLIERRDEPLDDSLARLVQIAQGAPPGAQGLSDLLVARLLEDGADDDAALLVVESLPVGDRLELDLPVSPDALAVARTHLRRWMLARGAPRTVIDDMAVACGEACANVIEHAYRPGAASFRLAGDVIDGDVVLDVRDFGSWREQRHVGRGRGTSVMRGLVDEVSVESGDGGTTVRLRRRLTEATG